MQTLRENILMIFIKNPVPGRVKTRLAATIGDEGALAIYQKLLKHTLQITVALKVKKMIFYSDFIPVNDAWDENDFQQELQRGADLGEKMKNAFQYVFEKHYGKAIIIGSDCFELSTAHLHQAFDRLNELDTVIGPARDGGYYLLGMNSLQEDFFQNKTWSSNRVYRDTMQDIDRLKLSCFNLPVLKDIDEADDLPPGLRLQYKPIVS